MTITDPTFPVGNPTVDGARVTVDALLANNGQIVARTIQNLSLQRFYLGQIFAAAGAFEGGVVLYEQATDNQLYADRDAETISPDTEYPQVTFSRESMKVAAVQKIGMAFRIPEESAIRNRTGWLQRRTVMAANTVRRKVEFLGMQALDTAISAFDRSTPGVSWADATGLTALTATPSAMPVADLTMVEQANEELELGYVYDFAIFHPQEARNLKLANKGTAGFEAMLKDSGINGYWVTNRQPAGKAKFLASKMIGELGFEAPLDGRWASAAQSAGAGDAPLDIQTQTYHDNGPDTDVFKVRTKPVVYVTDPYAVIELTGLAA